MTINNMYPYKAPYDLLQFHKLPVALVATTPEPGSRIPASSQPCIAATIWGLARLLDCGSSWVAVKELKLSYHNGYI